ncbi:MAG: hypothetical protein HW397_374, partial [Dehalococcoidia bacterium]|nr:hypothetical protein [Dehalococcoidia bacterium]
GIQGQVHAPGSTHVYNFRTGNSEMRQNKRHVFEAKTPYEARIV